MKKGKRFGPKQMAEAVREALGGLEPPSVLLLRAAQGYSIGPKEIEVFRSAIETEGILEAMFAGSAHIADASKKAKRSAVEDFIKQAAGRKVAVKKALKG